MLQGSILRGSRLGVERMSGMSSSVVGDLVVWRWSALLAQVLKALHMGSDDRCRWRQLSHCTGSVEQSPELMVLYSSLISRTKSWSGRGKIAQRAGGDTRALPPAYACPIRAASESAEGETVGEDSDRALPGHSALLTRHVAFDASPERHLSALSCTKSAGSSKRTKGSKKQAKDKRAVCSP